MLGLIEREPDDLDEIIGLRVWFVDIFAEDLEEWEMQDRSHPLPSHVKIREPMVIPQILAFIERETEIRAATLDVEVIVHEAADFYAKEIDFGRACEE